MTFKIKNKKLRAYKVTGFVKRSGKRETLTFTFFDKKKAVNTQKELQKMMKIAIPKYKWVRDIKVVQAKIR